MQAASKVPGVDEAALKEIVRELQALIRELEDWRAKVFRRRVECQRMGVVLRAGVEDVEMEMEMD